MKSVLCLGVAASVLGVSTLVGSPITTSVPGSAEIYTAGQVGGTAVQVSGLALGAGNVLNFTVKGAVSGAGCTSTTPDGCSNFLSNLAGTGVGRYSGPAQALVGIFIDGTTPAAAPATFVDSVSAASFAPGLWQPFFIGDGLTGTGAGSTQDFVVPTGATQLLLGMSDNPTYYYDNGGSFSVSITETGGLGSSNILVAEAPEPSTYFLVATALLGISLRRKK